MTSVVDTPTQQPTAPTVLVCQRQPPQQQPIIDDDEGGGAPSEPNTVPHSNLSTSRGRPGNGNGNNNNKSRSRSRTASRPNSAQSQISEWIQTPREYQQGAGGVGTRHCAGRAALCARNTVWSISFIVLLLAMCAVVVPVMVVWRGSVSQGLITLQQSYLVESMSRRADLVRMQATSSLESCERQLHSHADYANAAMRRAAAENSSFKFDLDFAFNVAFEHVTQIFTVHGGCAATICIFTLDGAFFLFEDSWFGPIVGFQKGFPPQSNISKSIYLYNVENFIPYWSVSIPVGSLIEPYPMFGGLSTDVLSKITNTNKSVWTPFALYKNSPIMASNLITGIVNHSASDEVKTGTTYPESLLAGFSVLLTERVFEGLFKNLETNGMLCLFVQDESHCLLASSCENSSIVITTSEVYRVCTFNSSVGTVRRSGFVLQELLAASRLGTSPVVITEGSVSYGFANITTDKGFQAVAVVIADLNYFEQAYESAKTDVTKWIIICTAVAGLVAGSVSLLTLLGQLQVMSRIRGIVHNSLLSAADGPSVIHGPLVRHNKIYPDSYNQSEDPQNTADEGEIDDGWKPEAVKTGTWGSSFFGSLSEISIILDKLDWLEGKVKIVCAFVPVVAKLVCHRGVSDITVLESKLSRRLGSYLFCDIEGFTPLCEAVSPDTAASVLEIFYDAVESAALAREHNLLVKRLGDGIFITWGFKLEVEENTKTRRYPILAYSAALKIAESALDLNNRIKEMIQYEAPNWNLTLRIGISTGPALHGLLKTHSLINPDVVGAMVNLASRCQSAGKDERVRDLGRTQLDPQQPQDRVLCTITSDMATHAANSHFAHSKVRTQLSEMASENVGSYRRHVFDNLYLQGIGESQLSVTYVTMGRLEPLSGV
ncbi:hypothetical protein Pelo_14991 [Pelomyxa schiedti]|nr:hypothetical protein Pelo_14991 [Pelomyxa schiedti]